MISLRVFIATRFLSYNCRAVFHMKNNLPLRPRCVCVGREGGCGQGSRMGAAKSNPQPKPIASSFPAWCKPRPLRSRYGHIMNRLVRLLVEGVRRSHPVFGDQVSVRIPEKE